jgi:hypothetical protein
LPKVGIALALLCAGLPAVVPRAAHADLYRWIDPETGSVKFSNLPPAEGRPAAVVPFRGAAAAPEPALRALDARTPLDERRRALQQAMLQTRFDPANPGALQKQAEAYQVLSQELDKLDPAGAAHRRAEDVALFEKMRAGLGAPGNPQQN